MLKVEGAPTMFGPVSVKSESRLSRGEVAVDVEAPPRAPAKMSLRVPLPPGWKVFAATLGGNPLTLGANSAVDLTGRTGELNLRLKVEATKP